jgi:DNA polymerase-3 subunit epsilon
MTMDVLMAQLERYDDLPRTPREIDTAMRHPDAVDRLGKLKWVNDEVTLDFGKHRGRSLRYLAREEPDYLRWLIQKEVVEDGEGHLRDALLGQFAKREGTT